MNAHTLCLAILNFRDATGYEIRKLSIDGNFSYFVDASYGAIYPTLKRLLDEGLVGVRTEQQAGKPARKVYSITPAGRQALCETLSEPPAPDIFKSQFLLVAMLAEHVEPACVERAVAARIAELQGRLDALHQARAKCDHEGSNWILDYGIAVHAASLDYVKANRSALSRIAGSALPAQAAE